MGHVFPREDALRFKDEYSLHVAIETGTYKGNTAEWLAEHFEQVYTLEAFESRYHKTKERIGHIPNLHMVLGDSRTALMPILRTLNEPVLFYLDAHWIGDAQHAYQIGDECPLREELEAVLRHEAEIGQQHVILIDDARLFTAPPPYPHNAAQWPTYAEIARFFPMRPPFIDQDVIFILPEG